MPQMITVVVATRDPGPALTGLVGGLDAQTARPDGFEVVFAERGSTDGSLARLERLSGSRPNVRVLPDATLADAVATAAGDHVLVLDQEWRLLPEALERLAARAAAGEVEVVAGRCRLDRGRYRGPLGGEDQAGPLSPAQQAELAGAVLLVRRDLLQDALADGDQQQDRWAARVLESAAAVAVVPDYACVCSWPAGPDQEVSPDQADGPARDTGAAAEPAVLSWAGEVLRVEVALTLPDGDEDVEHLLTLERADGVEIALPTSTTLLPVPLAAVPVDSADAESEEAGSGEAGSEEAGRTEPEPPEVTVEPEETSPAGAPVPAPETDTPRTSRILLAAELDCGPGAAPARGVYAVRLRRRGPSDGSHSVPVTGAAPALIAGRPVLAHPVDGRLVVDVGATATSLLAALPTAGTVTESARGSLLRLPLPDLHVCGAGGLTGTLALGGLSLPAEIAAEPSAEGWRGELRCFVSGLEGRSRLVAHFGGAEGGASPSGVDLVMSHLGAFTLEPTPPAPKKAAAAKPAANKAATTRKAAATKPAATPSAPAKKKAKPKPKKRAPARPPTRLQQLRRRVPPWLEPAVKPLAALPPARALYRRLNRR